jgi:type VI secretion system secreted protein VgrG
MPDNPIISISIPSLGADIEFARMEGADEIGAPFAYDLRISSRDFELKADTVLGTPATITVLGDDPRHFNGLVTEFGLHEIRADFAYFRLMLRPWLWLLTLRTNNRIFQNVSVIEIIEKVFGDYPAAKFEKRLQKTYPPREYCVQYGECDLDFIQRLMEHEGIFYFFEHGDEEHRLILTDVNTELKPAPGLETLAFEPDDRISFKDGAFITGWVPRAQVRPGKYAHTDYDFKKPSSDLTAKAESPLGHAEDKVENYAYPGDYSEHARGDSLSTLRLEEAQAAHVRIEAKGTAWQLWSGRTFKLDLFPREAENAEYIVLRTGYLLWDERVRSGQTDAEQGIEVTLTLAPTSIPFRLERQTKRRMMRGPQTAIVVGPAGEEIFTDEHARVKVQFYWDREGRKDENTTCFIRVSATWAGANWGFIQIPRIGQEVIVDFLEGDPDQPVITGRLYNAEQMPPYDLPGSASQSGWKSNSTPGGNGFNELRFEDKAGAEEVYFQAQKDHNELVKNNESREIGNDFAEHVVRDAKQDIGHNRHETVGNDKTLKVGHNRTGEIVNNDTETVGVDRKLTVGSNENINVGKNSTEEIGMIHSQTVGLAQKILVKAGRTDKVGLAESRVVGGIQTQTVGLKRNVRVGSSQTHFVKSDDTTTIHGNQSFAVSKNHTTKVDGDQALTLKGNQSFTITGGRLIKVSKGQTHDVAEDVWIKAGKTMMIEAADSIVIKTGSASISMKKDGTITIEGKDITLKASGKINAVASGKVKIEGSQINNN